MCKVEGISATLESGTLRLLMVTDADDAGQAALVDGGAQSAAVGNVPGVIFAPGIHLSNVGK